MTDAPTTVSTAENTDPDTGEIDAALAAAEAEAESPEDAAAIRSFLTFVAEQRYGALAAEASAALAEVIKAVTEHGKGGSMTLKISFKPAGKGKGDRRMLQISETIDLKLPEPERESALFYATDANGLSRTDPRALKLPRVEGLPVPAPVRDTPAPSPIREA